MQFEKLSKTSKIPSSFFLLLNLLYCCTLSAQNNAIWNINENGFFDSTDKAYKIENGCVAVNLDQQPVLCPTGLGHLVSGREVIKEIRFLFNSPVQGNYWLYISWDPGGSGTEQFEVLLNSISIGKSNCIDAIERPNQFIDEKFSVSLNKGANNITICYISGDGLHFKNIALTSSDKVPSAIRPTLKFQTLKSYESECGEAGIMLDSVHVRLFAPKRKANEAKIIFEYLVKAYDELYNIVGMHTEYKLVIYHFPENNEHAFGGTSDYAIWYSHKNLDLELQDEWRKYKIPHVSGYIEEMAHNFVHESRAQFGWEMIGWSISAKVTQKIAQNPIHSNLVKTTRQGQQQTFKQYYDSGYVFPKNLPANQCDRIHAYILWLCESKYGPNFWPDFFKEIHKERVELLSAESLGDNDKIRNKKYQITIDCFDRLPGLEFKQVLNKFQISLTTDVKSLHPTDPGWDRKLIESVKSTVP